MKMSTAWLLQVLKTVLVLFAMRGEGHHNGFSSRHSGHQAHAHDSPTMNPTMFSSPSSSSLSPSGEPEPSSSRSSMPSWDRLYRMRQWSRRHRLESIRHEILQRLGMRRPPSLNITPEARHRAMEALGNFPNLTEFQPVTERRCYSASCNIPNLVNETLWADSNNMGLRLYIPVPRDRGSGTNLQSAHLRLFLKPNPAACNCPCLDEEATQGRHCMSGLLVSVYQFLRPLSIRRRNRVVNRRRLLDAKFVQAAGNAWVSLNVENVVREWRRNRRNFGLEVTVKDDNDTEIDARRLFMPPDCSEGREVGCREDINESVRSMPPWFIDQRDNFPYVDTVTVRQPRSRKRRVRARRSVEHNISIGVKETKHGSTPQTTNQHLTCRGKDVLIKITDEKVIQPKSFTSRVCPSTCWDCKSGRCSPRPCLPPRTERVTGLYRMENGDTMQTLLPFTKILHCGC